jgi:hypothetical protein
VTRTLCSHESLRTAERPLISEGSIGPSLVSLAPESAAQRPRRQPQYGYPKQVPLTSAETL